MNSTELDLEIKYKICPKYKLEKNSNKFAVHKNRSDGLSSWCKMCNKNLYDNTLENVLKQKKIYYSTNRPNIRKKQKKYYDENSETRIVRSAKARAKKKGLPFNLTVDDIKIPEFCPVLGIKLQINKKYSQFSSPSIDKIIPEKGYVPGNVIIVSLKANQIKNCSTIEELELVYNFYRKLIKKET